MFKTYMQASDVLSALQYACVGCGPALLCQAEGPESSQNAELAILCTTSWLHGLAHVTS